MRILVVEDNERLASNIQEYLKLEHYSVDVVDNGKKAFFEASIRDYDLILLDVNLPEMDGLEICQALRAKKKETPIIMLTSRSHLEDKVSALNLGADDYLTKPFEFEELLARIKAQLRRSNKARSELIEIGDILVNMTNKQVQKNSENIPLSPKEFSILEYLIRNHGKYKNRGEILEHVWGSEGDELEFSSDTVEVHIAYLRKKLGKNIILTKRGYGYCVE